MSDLTTIEHRPAAKAVKAYTPPPKLKVALDLMVYGPADGDDSGVALDWLSACRAADYNVAAMRKMLADPRVILIADRIVRTGYLPPRETTDGYY